MAHSNKDKLMEEFVKRYFIVFRVMEASGFCRFVIRNGKIVARNWSGVFYNVFIVIAGDVGATAMLWTANRSDKDLSTVEFITIVYFAIFANLLLFQITFLDKYGGRDSIQNSIDIDNFLGPKETEFMRKLEHKMYITLVILIGFAQVIIVSYMYYVFHVSLLIHFVGSSYFFWILFVYDDFCFFLYSCLFLTCRARYINVALLKITNMKTEYIPKQSIFYKLFWRDEYDDRVTFHNRAENKDFVVAFKMLFHQLRHIERCYAFGITLGVFTIIMGSFVAVQTFIMYIQSSTAVKRAGAITGWAIASWFFILAFSLINDMFNKQIEQTKLICAYIQLKPSSSNHLLKLTKDIMALFEVRDARVSIYNVFIFNTGLTFHLAASTFVYITVQLQLAFPNLEGGHKFDNVTKPASYDVDRNLIKEVLFLY